MDMHRRRAELHAQHQRDALEGLKLKVNAVGDDALLTEYEAAAYLGYSVQWMRNRRVYGGSVPYVKIGGGVRYRFGEIKTAA